MSDPKSFEQEAPNEMINQQDADNRLISERNNSLILNYSRSKIKHDYKQLHHRDFVKAAKKIESIESSEHDLVTSKTFEQIINDSQTKK
jgi:DNA-binding transcriptional MocR family regulator